MKLSVCVVGGAGFLGSHLVEELMRRGHDVLVLSPRRQILWWDYDPGWMQGTPEVIEWSGGEFPVELCDAVINSGWYRTPDYIESYRRNISLTIDLIDAVRKGKASSLIQISSLKTGEHSVYGGIKGACDSLIRGADIDAEIYRPSTLFGPRQPAPLHRAFIPTLIYRWTLGKTIQHTPSVIEYQFVKNAARQIANLTEGVDEGQKVTWNVRSGDIIRVVRQAWLTGKIEGDDPPDGFPDIDYEFLKRLSETIEWYRWYYARYT